MNLTFVFWISALYTVALFGVQVYELLSGRAQFNFAAVNAAYLGLLSVYVGGKEVARWSKDEKRGGESVVSPDRPVAPSPTRAFRLPGEWFVGLWAVSLLAATILTQFWPARFTYPQGLTAIALEVLGFYLGSSVSRWLKVRDAQTHAAVEGELTRSAGDGMAAAESSAPRISKKRRRYEEKVMATAKRAGRLMREDVEKVTGLERSAALALLAYLVSAGQLRRQGDPGSTDTYYEPV